MGMRVNYLNVAKKIKYSDLAISGVKMFNVSAVLKLNKNSFQNFSLSQSFYLYQLINHTEYLCWDLNIEGTSDSHDQGPFDIDAVFLF